MEKNIDNKINEIVRNNNFYEREIVELLLLIEKNSSIRYATEKYVDFFNKLNQINKNQNGKLIERILKCIDYNIEIKINDERKISDKYEEINNFFEIAFFLSEEDTKWLEKRIEVYLFFIKQLDKITQVIDSGYSDLNFGYCDIKSHRYVRKVDFNEINILKMFIYKDLIFKCKYIDIIDDYILLLRELEEGKDEYFDEKFSINKLLPMFKSSKYKVNPEYLQLELIGGSEYAQLELIGCILRARGRYRSQRTFKSDEEIIFEKINNDAVLLNKLANLEYNYRQMKKGYNIKENTNINKAINKAPDQGMLYINRAMVNLESYKFDKVIEDIKKALEPGMRWNPEIEKFGIISKYKKSSFSKDDVLYKYLDSLCKVTKNHEFNYLLAEYITNLILKIEINHNSLKKICNKFRISFFIDNELIDKAINMSKIAYKTTQDTKYLKIIAKCLIYSNKPDQAIEYIKIDNNLDLDSELKYLLGYAYFICEKFNIAHDIFSNLYNQNKTQDNIKMYYNCLYFLKDYEKLIKLYELNELKIDDKIKRQNLKEIYMNMKSTRSDRYSKYNFKYCESETNYKKSNKVTKNYYNYLKTELDNEYERIIKIYEKEGKFQRMVEEAENMLDYEADPYVDWLGGVETEEEFWEHTD